MLQTVPQLWTKLNHHWFFCKSVSLSLSLSHTHTHTQITLQTTWTACLAFWKCWKPQHYHHKHTGNKTTVLATNQKNPLSSLKKLRKIISHAMQMSHLLILLLTGHNTCEMLTTLMISNWILNHKVWWTFYILQVSVSHNTLKHSQQLQVRQQLPVPSLCLDLVR